MMTLPITALAAGVLALWYLYLSLKVSFVRGSEQVSLGEGTNGSTMQRTVRVHGNAAEYIPLFLIVLGLLEFNGTRPEVLYVLAGIFLLGRVLHRPAILHGNVARRIWAMQLTHWPTAIGGAILIFTWFVQTVL
jgi:uncharacterized membrane protein YecN with MAPEG domain